MVAAIAPGVILHERFLVAGIAEDGPLGKTCLVRDQQVENLLCVLTEFAPPQAEPDELYARYQQFQAIAAPIYQLSHPQIPKFQWLALQDQAFYWVREYIPGKSCSVLLYEAQQQGDRFTEEEILSLLAGVLPTLHYLHRQGVVHRNLCPSSLIIRESDQLPVLINFGLVKELVCQLQLHPVPADLPLYSWGYTPPEQQHSGKVLPSSDLYALAMTAVVLLTGQEPDQLFDERTQSFDWERWVEVHPLLGQVLRQMLQPHPAQRFNSALQVMQALQPLIGQVPEVADVLDYPGSRVLALTTAAQQMPGELKPARHRWIKRWLRPELLAWGLLVGTIVLFGGATFAKVRQLRVAERTAPVAAKAAPANKSAKVPGSRQPMVPEARKPTDSNRSAPGSAIADRTALKNRANQLSVDYDFVATLTDEVFAQQNPGATGDLTGAQQQQWNQLALALLNQLNSLPTQLRQKLGSYGRTDYDRWVTELGERQPTSPRLDRLADQRFYQLFPEQKGKVLNRKTFGQVWYALAEEQLPQAKNIQ